MPPKSAPRRKRASEMSIELSVLQSPRRKRVAPQPPGTGTSSGSAGSLQRVRLERHVLRAPFAGVIGTKHTEVGQWLNAGNTAFQLVQLDPLRVQAKVPELVADRIWCGAND